MFAVTDKLYIYDINNYNINNSLNIKPLCWNSMVVINEKEQIVAVGCQGCTYIIKINSINDIKIINEIKLGKTSHESLCLFENCYLIIGLRNGDIRIFDIKNNYQLISSIIKAHNIKNNFSINGITQISDYSFASYGENKIIKIWN